MRIVRTVQAMRHERARWTGSVGLVPTMGYLHEGHLSLMRRARAEQEKLAVSIFVNPAQFGPHEDFTSYPRDIEHDLHLLETIGVDAVFVPSVSEMYPQGFATYVTPSGIMVEQGEGAIRPTHFRGVTTVVNKLFQIVQPQYAYFGQKDAQQVTVLQQMIRDLNLPVTITTVSTVREPDGLAKSSRNSYLTPTQRALATILYRALQAGQQAYQQTQQATVEQILQAVRATVAQEPEVHLNYVDWRDPVTFLPLTTLQPPALLLIAAHVGTTRLIDNFALQADGTWDTGTFIAEERTKNA
jgi:pantoate--beta-alanine ligase